jgi:hypothetical protein
MDSGENSGMDTGGFGGLIEEYGTYCQHLVAPWGPNRFWLFLGHRWDEGVPFLRTNSQKAGGCWLLAIGFWPSGIAGRRPLPVKPCQPIANIKSRQFLTLQAFASFPRSTSGL